MVAPLQRKTSVVDKLGSMAKRILIPQYGDHTASISQRQFNAFVERNSLTSLFSWRDFDAKSNLMFLDDNYAPAVGFGIRYSPLLLAGTDTETQLEGLINRIPDGAVLHFGIHSSDAVHTFLDSWKAASIGPNATDLLRQLAEKRAEFMEGAARKHTLVASQRWQARDIRYYLFVRIPYLGDVADEKAMDLWVSSVLDLRQNLIGTLSSIRIATEIMDESTTRKLLRSLVNPHRCARENDDTFTEFGDLKSAFSTEYMNFSCVENSTRLKVIDDGSLSFDDGNSNRTRVSCVTVDAYPAELYLQSFGNLMGKLEEKETIVPQYYMYTNIVKENTEKAVASLQRKLSVLNKQCVSTSEWYKSMMIHLFRRKDETTRLINMTRQEHSLVRMYTGINVYTTDADLQRDTDIVIGLWRKLGFKASPERYISGPVWLCSLPYQYAEHLDIPTQGISRATMVHSYNAACAVPIQGDWNGTPPFKRRGEQILGGGPLLLTYHNVLSSLDLFQNSTSYNFVITATSGAGKSFFANDIVRDTLSKGGVVRAIDAGGSYAKIAGVLGGTILQFDPLNPLSMNPFWGITELQHDDRSADEFSDLDPGDQDAGEINEMMPLLVALVVQMAFPNKSENDIDSWYIKFIDTAIYESWQKHKEILETRHIYEYCLAYAKENNEPRARSLADQLKPVAVGRYAAWFNGKPEITLTSQFQILELDNLNQDKSLRGIILTLVINYITREMYLKSRSIRKLLLIDEAWDLLADAKSASFIERVYRVIRKYNGAAGVITQKFDDYERSEAAKAAFANAPWKITMMNASTSFEYAIRNKMLTDSDWVNRIVTQVKPGEDYSEVFITNGESYGFYRFIVDPYTYYVYTTNAMDLTEIDRLERQGMTMVDVINQLGQKRMERILS